MSDSSKRSGWKSFAAGTVAGVANVAVGHPLDTMKVRWQTTGMQQTIQQRSLFAGISGPLLTTPMLAGVNFGLWDYFRVRLTVGCPEVFAADGYSRSPMLFCPESASSGYSIFVAGVGSGWVCCNLTVPMQNFKVQQQTAQADCRLSFRDVVKTVGWKSLFRGYAPHAFAESFGRGFYMLGFVVSKRTLGVDQKSDANLVTRIFCGAIGGACAWVSIYPADTLRSRMMKDFRMETYSGVLDCMRKVYAEQGVLGFYRGVGVTLIRSMPVAAVTLPTYDYALSVLS